MPAGSPGASVFPLPASVSRLDRPRALARPDALTSIKYLLVGELNSPVTRWLKNNVLTAKSTVVSVLSPTSSTTVSPIGSPPPNLPAHHHHHHHHHEHQQQHPPPHSHPHPHPHPHPQPPHPHTHPRPSHSHAPSAGG
eukprot:1173955-Prorocentrum_minimum.AAC.2